MGNEDLNKSLKDYEEYYNRPIPIRYDILRFDDLHRKFDALIRRYWNDFHPLVRDIFTSFASEFQYLIDELENVEEKTNEKIEEALKEKESEFEILKNELEQKINELELRNDMELSNFEKNLDERDEFKEKYENTQKILTEKEKLIQSQKIEIQKLNQTLGDVQRKKMDQEKTITSSIKNVETFTETLDTLAQELKVLETENQTQKETINSLQTQLTNSSLRSDKENEKLNYSLNKLKKHLETAMKFIEKGKSDKLKSEETIKKLNQDIVSLKETNQELKKENERMLATISNKEMQKSPPNRQELMLASFNKANKAHESSKSIVQILDKFNDEDIETKSEIQNDVLNENEKTNTNKISETPSNIPVESENLGTSNEEKILNDEGKKSDNNVKLDITNTEIPKPINEKDIEVNEEKILNDFPDTPKTKITPDEKSQKIKSKEMNHKTEA